MGREDFLLEVYVNVSHKLCNKQPQLNKMEPNKTNIQQTHHVRMLKYTKQTNSTMLDISNDDRHHIEGFTFIKVYIV